MNFLIQIRQMESGAWTLRVLCQRGRPEDIDVISNERTKREYASAEDAITSARHVVHNYDPRPGGAR